MFLEETGDCPASLAPAISHQIRHTRRDKVTTSLTSSNPNTQSSKIHEINKIFGKCGPACLECRDGAEIQHLIKYQIGMYRNNFRGQASEEDVCIVLPREDVGTVCIVLLQDSGPLITSRHICQRTFTFDRERVRATSDRDVY